nr:polysaccharide pyruvyl transferase family protein [Aquibacillus sediminis]
MKGNKRKILYIGWIGHNNLGDELMWHIFKEKFDTLFGDENWEVEGTIRKPSTAFNIDAYDLVVLGGGSIICENNTPVLYKAIKKGKKVMIWGAGMDLIQQEDVSLLQAEKSINIDRYFSRNIQQKLVEVIDHAEFVGVRGPLTYEILRQMGAKENKIMVSGDPGLLLPKENEEVDFVEKLILPFKGQKIVGINWGTSFNHVFGGNESHVELQLVDSIQELIEKGYKIYLYTVWDQDIPAIKRLYEQLNDPGNVIMDTNLYDQNILVQLMSHFDFTINFKLHANIISYVAGTPFIALAYRFKVFDFTSSINLEPFAVATDDRNIKSKILKLENRISMDRLKFKAQRDEQLSFYTQRLDEPFDKHLFL